MATATHIPLEQYLSTHYEPLCRGSLFSLSRRSLPLKCSLPKTNTAGQERIDDFINFHVPNVWVIDPIRRIGWNCSDGNWIRQERFAVSGTPVYLSLDELFHRIDEEEKD